VEEASLTDSVLEKWWVNIKAWRIKIHKVSRFRCHTPSSFPYRMVLPTVYFQGRRIRGIVQVEEENGSDILY
jgi:hypothetical protein